MDSSSDTGSIPGASSQSVDDVSLLLDTDDDDSDFGPMAQDLLA